MKYKFAIIGWMSPAHYVLDEVSEKTAKNCDVKTISVITCGHLIKDTIDGVEIALSFNSNKNYRFIQAIPAKSIIHKEIIERDDLLEPPPETRE